MRGVLNLTDIHNQFQVSDNPHIDAKLPLSSTDVGVRTIFVNNHALESFIDNFLDRIQFPFVLISGDSDLSVTDHYPSPEKMQRLLNYSFMQRWYSQNLSLENDKLYHIPIGVDFHNLWEKPGKQEPFRWSPLSHEVELKKIITAGKQPDQRIPLAYCNWHFTMHRGERAQCYNETNHALCYFETQKLQRLDAYRAQSNFSFVLSPQGKGMDCYRTWEALALGSIPIVKKSPLDPLFSDLPVLILNNWSELSTDVMQKTLDSFSNRKFNYQKLFLSYWKKMVADGPDFDRDTALWSREEYMERIRLSIL